MYIWCVHDVFGSACLYVRVLLVAGLKLKAKQVAGFCGTLEGQVLAWTWNWNWGSTSPSSPVHSANQQLALTRSHTTHTRTHMRTHAHLRTLHKRTSARTVHIAAQLFEYMQYSLGVTAYHAQY